eukprot:5331780-Ditylum_brightwellii.AAC.1
MECAVQIKLKDSDYMQSYGDCMEQMNDLGNHSMDCLIPDTNDYNDIHMDNATLPTEEEENIV